jgi:hypothetical protein
MVIYLMLMALGAVPFFSPSLATGAPSRADCHEISHSGSSLRGVFGAFQDITPEYIRSTFSTDTPQSLQHQGKIDEIRGGAIALVITNKGQLSKLLATMEGIDLLIRKFETYGSAGGKIAEGENRRVSRGGRLDLDAGAARPAPTEADLQWEGKGSAKTLKAVNGARFKILVAIPVIAHYMNSKADEGRSKNVQDEFLPKTLHAHFAPSGRDGSINTIWGQAGILFFLYRLEDCRYSLRDFQPTQAQSHASRGIPSPEDDCQCLFRRINGVYNFPEVRGLDLYLWSSIGLKVAGYGAPHRRDGPSPGPGAIWVDRLCHESGCGFILAHEAGHFLLGCHICSPPEEKGHCAFCGDIPPCSAEHRGLLMQHSDAGTGTRLTSDQIRDARKKALEYWWATGVASQ